MKRTRSDGFSSRFVEARSGLSLEVPGHSTLLVPEAVRDGFGLTCEGIIGLEALSLSLHVSVADTHVAPTALADYVRTYVEPRTRAPGRIHFAGLVQRARMGVEAAASTRHPLAQPTETGADAEELLVLLRKQQVVVLSKRLVLGQTPPVGFVLWNTALTASLEFLDVPGTEAPAVQWPQSEFLHPGIVGTLTEKGQAFAATLREAFADLSPGEQKELLRRGAQLLTGSEPANTPLSDEDRLLLTQFLGDACPGEEQEAPLTAAAAIARTSHDVRGIGVMILTALDAFAPLPERSPLDALLLYAI